MKIFLSLFALMLGTTLGTNAHAACQNGAPADAPYCRFFKVYAKEDTKPPQDVVSALKAAQNEKIRSIAILLGVYHYPKLGDLTPAENDVKHLEEFLIKDQAFDEVIELENEDVNITNLQYLMTGYLFEHLPKYDKTRVLIAYTGHGVSSPVAGLSGSLVMSAAENWHDYKNMITMGQFKQYLSQIAPLSYHLLAVINACFGGDVFTASLAGGNPYTTNKRGARALTAGANDQLVYSLGEPGQGSIFFDSLIHTVTSGIANAQFRLSDGSGKVVYTKRNIVLLGDLHKYITQDVDAFSAQKNTDFSDPWEGSVAPPPIVSESGFFFLNRTTTVAAFGLGETPPTGTVSSIQGRPDIKVFNQPEEYEINGVDVSSYNGEIRWAELPEKFLEGGFVYARATMGADRQDPLYTKNWSTLASLANSRRLDRGAYHVFDFCQDAYQQVSNIEDHVKPEQITLPLAIDVEYSSDAKGMFKSDWHRQQQDCINRYGLPAERTALMTVLSSVQKYFNKTPIIFGEGHVFDRVLNSDFRNYPIWLHDYGKTSLPGANPWTFWQYTNTGRIKGLEHAIDENVFFGTRQDFDKFRESGENIALYGKPN